MKPRIRLVQGIWCCWTLDRTLKAIVYGRDFICGYGYTPRQAWEDWRARCVSS